jgi:hypothetical protein
MNSTTIRAISNNQKIKSAKPMISKTGFTSRESFASRRGSGGGAD